MKRDAPSPGGFIVLSRDAAGIAADDEAGAHRSTHVPAATGAARAEWRIDGSLSSLAPIFAVALATREPHYAFVAGLATALGAAISMAFSEGLSDTGEVTERGSPWVRGAIVGGGTFLGGILHSCRSFSRRSGRRWAQRCSWYSSSSSRWPGSVHRFFLLPFRSSLASVAVGGVLIAAVSAAIGAALGQSTL